MFHLFSVQQVRKSAYFAYCQQLCLFNFCIAGSFSFISCQPWPFPTYSDVSLLEQCVRLSPGMSCVSTWSDLHGWMLTFAWDDLCSHLVWPSRLSADFHLWYDEPYFNLMWPSRLNADFHLGQVVFPLDVTFMAECRLSLVVWWAVLQRGVTFSADCALNIR